MSKKLQPYRTRIDDLDNQILTLLAERFDIVREVGTLKTAENITIVQAERAQAVIERVTTLAKTKNIPPELIKEFYEKIIAEAHKIEFAIQAENSADTTNAQEQEAKSDASDTETLKQEARKAEGLTGTLKDEQRHA